MPDVVTVNKKKQLVEVHSSGHVQESDIMNSMEEMIEIYKETGINRILVNVVEQLSVPNSIDMFTIFSKFPREFQVAMIISDEQKTLEDSLFIETVAQNRGIPIKTFKSREEAEKWLGV